MKNERWRKRENKPCAHWCTSQLPTRAKGQSQELGIQVCLPCRWQTFNDYRHHCWFPGCTPDSSEDWVHPGSLCGTQAQACLLQQVLPVHCQVYIAALSLHTVSWPSWRQHCPLSAVTVYFILPSATGALKARLYPFLLAHWLAGSLISSQECNKNCPN